MTNKKYQWKEIVDSYLENSWKHVVNSIIDITIIQTFFEAMSTEDKETQMSVQEALSMMAPAFKAMDGK